MGEATGWWFPNWGWRTAGSRGAGRTGRGHRPREPEGAPPKPLKREKAPGGVECREGGEWRTSNGGGVAARGKASELGAEIELGLTGLAFSQWGPRCACGILAVFPQDPARAPNQGRGLKAGDLLPVHGR